MAAKPQIDEPMTLGDQLADKIAIVGGSWTFIICFCLVMFVWITLNVCGAMEKPFDPYPFILLNLVLSCLAALQAPIIMMSQNRQAKKDRAEALADFETNVEAEKEIRNLHLKIDELMKMVKAKDDI